MELLDGNGNGEAEGLESGPDEDGARAAWVPPLLWLAVIAGLTLTPDRGAGDLGTRLDPFCVLCGERGLADFILNVGLFVPLGAALARWVGWRWAVVAGLALSGSIELLQTGIPGRFPTVGDVTSNTLGAGLGAAAFVLVSGMGRLPRRAALALAALPALCTLAPALLLAPSFTGGWYYAQWAPSLPNPRAYRGRVLEASVAGRPTHIGRLGRTDSVRAALARGEPIRIRFEAVASPARLSPVYRIADARNREIAMVGVSGPDLVFEARTLASTLALSSVPSVWTGAMARAAPGDTVEVIAQKESGALCLHMDGRTRCDLQPSLGRAGWQLLIVPDPADSHWAGAVTLLWLCAMWALVGIAAWTPRLGALLAPAAAIAFALVAAASPWVSLRPVEAAAVAAGVLAGGLVRRALGARGARA